MMKNYKKTFLICIILFVIFSISIGYSAFSSELSISKIVADVRVKQDIRITDISVYSSSSINGNYGVPKIEYDADSIILTQVFASYDDFIEVSVNITNFGNTNMGIFNISVPQGIDYKLTDYELKDKLCDDVGKCNLGARKIIKLKMYPTSDEGFNLENSNVDFDFREMHSITYSGVTNNGYTTEIINGDNLSINFTSDIPENIIAYSNGEKINSSKYNYSNGTLVMNNVSGDLIIKSVKNLYNMIKLKTNGVDTNISFKVSSSETNGDGVNTLSGTENNQYPVYYYRGAVEDNNIRFANFCWKMVRTTETGGVKLIYNGIPAEDGSCNNTGTDSQIGTSVFNHNHTSPAYAGYMYGIIYTVNSKALTDQNYTYIYGNDVVWDGVNYTLIDTISSSNWISDAPTLETEYHYTCFNDTGVCQNIYYVVSYDSQNDKNDIYYLTLSDGKNIEKAKEAMFTNTTDSTIKTIIDKWYAANMNSYTNYLEDTIWCNDRTLISGLLYSKDSETTTTSRYASYDRNMSTFKPSVTCTETRDSFTVSSSNGNGKLTYPVGLLTADEYTIAGSGNKGNSESAYLYTGTYYSWTLSPSGFGSTGTGAMFLQHNRLYANKISNACSVRPSVSLKQGTYVSGGDGSVSNPYIVE